MTDESSASEAGRVILTRMLSEQPARLPRKMRAAGYDENDADDLAQEALLRAVRSIATLRGPVSESLVCGWVDSIANNLVSNTRRGQARRPKAVSLDAQLSTDVELADVGEEIASLTALRSLLDSLPDEQRAVFVGRVLEDRPTKELADELGISQDLVRWRLRRARNRLRERLIDSDSDSQGVARRSATIGSTCLVE